VGTVTLIPQAKYSHGSGDGYNFQNKETQTELNDTADLLEWGGEM